VAFNPLFILFLLIAVVCFIVGFTFPSLMWISYVYHQGNKAPGPRDAIFKALLWGMFSTIPAGIINTFSGIPLAGYIWLVPIMVAPINEEFFKPLGLGRLNVDIRSRIDGLIFGVTCGMGFAMTENLLYELGFIVDPAVWTAGAFLRGVGSTIIHGVGSGIIGYMYAGYYLNKKMAREKRFGGGMPASPASVQEGGAGGTQPSGPAKGVECFEDKGKLPWSTPGKSPTLTTNAFWNLVLGYLIAVGIHSGWNTLATISAYSSDLVSLLIVVVLFLYAGFCFLLLKYLIERCGGTMRFHC